MQLDREARSVVANYHAYHGSRSVGGAVPTQQSCLLAALGVCYAAMKALTCGEIGGGACFRLPDWPQYRTGALARP